MTEPITDDLNNNIATVTGDFLNNLEQLKMKLLLDNRC